MPEQRQIELAEDGVIDWVVQRINGPHLRPYLTATAIEGGIGDLTSWCRTYRDGTECYIITTLSIGYDTQAEALAKAKELEARYL